MLVDCNLHNLFNLEIIFNKGNQLFALVDCEEFKKIRHLHIIFHFQYGDKFDLEKSDDNIKPEDAGRKYVTDVFNAFPDVSFTMEYRTYSISIKEAIYYQKKYQNVVFKFEIIQDRTYSAFSEHLK
jgi:hypothetical protein